MDKTALTKVVKDVRATLAKNSPAILTGVGIAGFVGAAISVGKATPKAMMLIEEKKLDLDVDELSKFEAFKTVWFCYIPAGVLTLLSIGCIMGAQSINIKRNAALATAYTLSETALKEYKDKVIETIGEKKERAVRDEIAKDKLKANPVNNNEVVVTKKGNTLCYEPFSGRYFRSDADEIRRALNMLNEQLLKDEYVNLNDFYDLIGLGTTQIGHTLGWHIQGGLIEILFVSDMAENDEPCLMITFADDPTYNYSTWY